MYLLKFVAKRLLWLLPSLFGVIVIIFVISHIIPADPVKLAAGDSATPEQVEALREKLGFDRPLPMQLVIYVKNLIQGDFGKSLFTGRPVIIDLVRRLPATIELTLVAMLVTVFVGIPLGVVSALRRNSLLDHAVRVITVSGLAIASFWLGIMLQLTFAMAAGWLPLGGRFSGFPPPTVTGLYLVDTLIDGDWAGFWTALRYITLPALTLAFPAMATVVRFTRSGVLDSIKSAYVLHERAMGFPAGVITWKYVLRNALMSTITQIGLLFGILLGGAVVIETVFDWPGLGYYAFNSIVMSDYNAILGFTVWVAVIYMLVNLAVDVVLVLVDPRTSRR